MALPASFTFNNDIKMPAVGLGCWMGQSGEAEARYEMVLKGLKLGYRYLDTISSIFRLFSPHDESRIYVLRFWAFELSGKAMSVLDNFHKTSGFHGTVVLGPDTSGNVFDWMFDQLGWGMAEKGRVIES